MKKAGISGINLSLDCIDKDLFREITRGGDIDKVILGIKLAQKENIKIFIIGGQVRDLLLDNFNDQDLNFSSINIFLDQLNLDDFLKILTKSPLPKKILD